MSENDRWTSLALLASSVLQNFELRRLRSDVNEIAHANLSRDVRELQDRNTKKQQDTLREFIFQTERLIDETTSEIASKSFAVSVKAFAARNLVNAVGLTPKHFSELADKDRVKRLDQRITEAIQNSEAKLAPEEKERAANCAKFLVEKPALEEIIRVRKRVDELGVGEWTVISSERRAWLLSLFGDLSPDQYVRIQRQRADYIKTNLPEGDEQKGLQAVIDENVVSDEERQIREAIEIIRREKIASAPILQRRLRVGYQIANEIMEELDRRGIVGPNKGAEPRDILIG